MKKGPPVIFVCLANSSVWYQHLYFPFPVPQETPDPHLANDSPDDSGSSYCSESGAWLMARTTRGSKHLQNTVTWHVENKPIAAKRYLGGKSLPENEAR